MSSIPTTDTFKRRCDRDTIVYSPPNTSGHPNVISTMSTKAETESETETETETDVSADNEYDSFVNQYLGDRIGPDLVEEIQNQMGLPENQISRCDEDKDEGKVPEHNDVGIQTEGDMKVDSENNRYPKKLVLLEKKAKYASLNIEMTGGTIVKPVFNVLADGRGKRKTSTHREGQTTAKKTKKAKFNF
ncbi:hypothetical protein M378DRAFT_11425 [Amanita muscaria Koide BX008]|uniref:Uncharacterized protein n=1 Tax=Amanita muscaria (strain Koide BX008) TaxID=946122 RepID=A0A0C2X7E0_AMAMK|nr:hypothetical protein M378DRAFT_11425 [Amanita muscaria Koide BX008]